MASYVITVLITIIIVSLLSQGMINDAENKAKEQKRKFDSAIEKLASEITDLNGIIQEYREPLNPKDLALRNIQMVLQNKIIFDSIDIYSHSIPINSQRREYIEDMLKIIKELNEYDGGYNG